MDTSKAYIKMCDCPEIQDKDMGGLYMFNHGPVKGRLYWSDTEIGKSADVDIWLPRQDQIQEMLFPSLEEMQLSIIEMIEEFDVFVMETNLANEALGSMEQLWLAFYMHEKYQKIWNGKKWTKE